MGTPHITLLTGCCFLSAQAPPAVHRSRTPSICVVHTLQGPAHVHAHTHTKNLTHLAGALTAEPIRTGPTLTRDTVRSVISCSKARVSSACFWLCSAIFSLNFLGFEPLAPGEPDMVRPAGQLVARVRGFLRAEVRLEEGSQNPVRHQEKRSEVRAALVPDVCSAAANAAKLTLSRKVDRF